jgi:hypothetical protein
VRTGVDAKFEHEVRQGTQRTAGLLGDLCVRGLDLVGFALKGFVWIGTKNRFTGENRGNEGGFFNHG